MVNCAIVGCSNNSRKDVGCISYYRLPKNDMLKKTWLIKIGRDKSNLPKEDNIRICHVHFTEECFKRDLEVIISYDPFCCKCFFEIPLSVA